MPHGTPLPTPQSTYFPQAPEAFVASASRSGFNACNSPKSFLSIIYISTPPSVLFFKEVDDKILG